MSDRIKVEGAVFANTYKKAKNHPDFTGKIELSKTLLKELVGSRLEGCLSAVVFCVA